MPKMASRAAGLESDWRCLRVLRLPLLCSSLPNDDLVDLDHSFQPCVARPSIPRSMPVASIAARVFASGSVMRIVISVPAASASNLVSTCDSQGTYSQIIIRKQGI